MGEHLGNGAQAAHCSFAVSVSSVPRVRPRDARSSVSAWILNDDVCSTCFQTCKHNDLLIVRVVDGRLLQQSGASRRALLEDLREQKPDLLCGLLKALFRNSSKRRRLQVGTCYFSGEVNIGLRIRVALNRFCLPTPFGSPMSNGVAWG